MGNQVYTKYLDNDLSANKSIKYVLVIKMICITGLLVIDKVSTIYSYYNTEWYNTLSYQIALGCTCVLTT